MGAVTPVPNNANIDGTAFAMTAKSSTQGGVLYQYSTKLAQGTHNFTFTFSDSKGTNTTMPFNGVQMPGPTVYPFRVITAGSGIDFPVSLPGQKVTLSATYFSPANIAPTRAEIDIDGTPYAM